MNWKKTIDDIVVETTSDALKLRMVWYRYYTLLQWKRCVPSLRIETESGDNTCSSANLIGEYC